MQERSRRAMQFRPGVEEKFIRGETPVGDGGREVVGGTVDDEVAEDGLPLEERGVEGGSRVELEEAGEEGGLGGGEDGVEVEGFFGEGRLREVAEEVAFVAFGVD